MTRVLNAILPLLAAANVFPICPWLAPPMTMLPVVVGANRTGTCSCSTETRTSRRGRCKSCGCPKK